MSPFSFGVDIRVERYHHQVDNNQPPVPAPAPETFTKLYVKGFAGVVSTREQLVKIFAPFGRITGAGVVETNHGKLWGFVKYSEPPEAQKAVSQMNGVELEPGVRLYVSKHVPKINLGNKSAAAAKVAGEGKGSQNQERKQQMVNLRNVFRQQNDDFHANFGPHELNRALNQKAEFATSEDVTPVANPDIGGKEVRQPLKCKRKRRYSRNKEHHKMCSNQAAKSLTQTEPSDRADGLILALKVDELVVPRGLLVEDVIEHKSQVPTEKEEEDYDNAIEDLNLQLQLQMFRNMEAEQQENTPNPDQVQEELPVCNICYDDHQPENCVSLPCGQMNCKPCLTNWFTFLINNRNVASILCPDADCEGEIPTYIIQSSIPANLYARYDAILLEDVLSTMQDIVFCPIPTCLNPVNLDNICPTLGKCLKCGHIFCTNCEEQYHGFTSCDEFESDAQKQRTIDRYRVASIADKTALEKRYGKIILQKALNEKLNEACIKDNCKACPHCRVNIEKKDGCNKMICRCGAYFCWLCNALLDKSNPYGHFGRGCVLFEDDGRPDLNEKPLLGRQYFVERPVLYERPRVIERPVRFEPPVEVFVERPIANEGNGCLLS